MCPEGLEEIKTYVKCMTQDLVLPNYVIGLVSAQDRGSFWFDITMLEDELEEVNNNRQFILS